MLTDDDFPIQAIGDRVYARRQSSPICVAQTDQLATEIALRLNRDSQCYPDDQP